MTQESAAIRLGLAQSTVANKLRILKLNAEERKIILDNNLSERHARALLKITDNDRRLAVLNKAAESGWTVDALEKYIAKLLKDDEKRASYHKRAAMLKDVRLKSRQNKMFHMEQKKLDRLKSLSNFFICRCKKAVPSMYNRYRPGSLWLLHTPCNAHQG